MGALQAAFIEVEEELNLWSRSALGQRYWHSVRYPLFGLMAQALRLMAPRHGSWRDRPLTSHVKFDPPRIRQALERGSWRDLDHAPLLVIPHTRFLESDGAWVCPYTGPLTRDLRVPYWSIKDLYQARHQVPLRDPRIRYLDHVRRAAEMRFDAARALGRHRLNRLESADVRRWADELRQRVGGGPDADRVLKLVRGQLRHLVTLDDVYERLLDQVRPRLVVMAVHYSHRNIPLTRVARRRGIPVAELQHGFIGADHLAYTLAPGRRPSGFPDYLLTFGDWWRECTPGLPLDAEHCPAVGYAWLDEHRAAARSRSSDGEVGTQPRTVLFISQGTIGRPLSEVAAELARSTAESGVRVRFKLHPSELEGWRGRYPALVGAPLEVMDQPSPLYDAFVDNEIVVGVYSTALFEGLAFGRPTCVVRLRGWQAMQPLAEAGVLTVVDDARDLETALATAAPPAPEVVEALWATNSTERFARFVDTMLASG